MIRELTAERIRAARWLALGVDLLQVVLLPTFLPGFLSPAVEIVDVLAAIALVTLVGWHWAFLPTFVAELIPFVDLVPTWTAAVLIATRHGPSVPVPAAAPPVTLEPRPAQAPPPLPAGDQEPRRDSSGS